MSALASLGLPAQYFCNLCNVHIVFYKPATGLERPDFQSTHLPVKHMVALLITVENTPAWLFNVLVISHSDAPV